MTRAITLAALVLAACGYSEPQMQSQRDQIEQLHGALAEVANTSQDRLATIERLTAENERLSKLCTEVTP